MLPSLFVLLSILSFASSAYIELKTGQQKCFMLHTLANENILVHVQVPQVIGIQFYIRCMVQGREVVSKQLVKKQDKITISLDGEAAVGKMQQAETCIVSRQNENNEEALQKYHLVWFSHSTNFLSLKPSSAKTSPSASEARTITDNLFSKISAIKSIYQEQLQFFNKYENIETESSKQMQNIQREAFWIVISETFVIISTALLFVWALGKYL